MPIPGELSRVISAHASLYAPFDASMDAAVSRGNPAALVNAAVVRHDPRGGRSGGSLVFNARDHGWAEDEFRFAARDNFPYRESAFDGTISLWLRCDPDAELAPEYPVDPFHISRHASDASFYFDLTKPNDWRYGSPRKLRFGYYNDSPEQNMFVGGHLIVAGELGWNDGRWHHVVATWRNANSGQPDGAAALYVDGRLRGTMERYEHRLTWNLDAVRIGLGQRFVGGIDELLILDTALPADSVRALFEAGEKVASVWR